MRAFHAKAAILSIFHLSNCPCYAAFGSILLAESLIKDRSLVDKDVFLEEMIKYWQYGNISFFIRTDLESIFGHRLTFSCFEKPCKNVHQIGAVKKQTRMMPLLNQ